MKNKIKKIIGFSIIYIILSLLIHIGTTMPISIGKAFLYALGIFAGVAVLIGIVIILMWCFDND